MHANANTRMSPWVGVPATLTRRDRRLLAGLLMGMLVATAFVFLADHRDPFAFGSNPAPGQGTGPTASGRDPLLWPFSRDSIWNLPIGADARYVWAGIRHATSMAYFTDADVLVLEPSAPATTVYTNYDDWGGGDRCSAQGPALFTVPIPSGFVIPGSHQGSPDGNTPNAATAILASDGHTLIQTQPFARCVAGNSPTSHYMFGSEDLYGTGETGSHGGSGLSALGGTVRLGELVPGGAIRHSLKLNIDSANFYPGLGGYRWPAWKSDAGGAGYSGSIPEVRMGSLLAVKTDFSIPSLETEPGKIVARSFMDYGAYIVDTSGWSIYNFVTERSPKGAVQDEFQSVWGYSLNTGVGANGWARDLDKIFTNLYVVDSWDASVWSTVSASGGSLGVGLGAPHVAWAPDFGTDTTPPEILSTLSGTAGSGTWYLSSVGVTVSATDAGSGVASIHLRRDGGAWEVYTAPVTISGEGSHTVEYYATDSAGNNAATKSRTFAIDTAVPVTSISIAGAPAPGGGYMSPVTITLSSSDLTSGVATVQYRIDAGAWRSYTGPVPLAGNGTHILETFGSDAAGNREATRTQSLTLKGAAWSPPLSTMSAAGTSGTNSWYVTAVTVTLHATSGSGSAPTISYSVDNGAWTSYGAPFQFQEGRHFLVHQASDSAGYYGPATSETIIVDWTAPTLTSSSGNLVIRPDASLVWIGSDALSGIARYEVSVDGGAFRAIGTQPQLAGPWTVGSHSVAVKAVDGAGNLGTTTIPFRADADAPAAPTPTPPAPAFPIPNPLNVLRSGNLYYILTFISLTVAGLLVRRMRTGREARRERAGRRGSDRSSSNGGWAEPSEELDDDTDLPM
jgi:hypothetical protein